MVGAGGWEWEFFPLRLTAYYKKLEGNHNIG